MASWSTFIFESATNPIKIKSPYGSFTEDIKAFGEDVYTFFYLRFTAFRYAVKRNYISKNWGSYTKMQKQFVFELFMCDFLSFKVKNNLMNLFLIEAWSYHLWNPPRSYVDFSLNICTLFWNRDHAPYLQSALYTICIAVRLCSIRNTNLWTQQNYT